MKRIFYYEINRELLPFSSLGILTPAQGHSWACLMESIELFFRIRCLRDIAWFGMSLMFRFKRYDNCHTFGHCYLRIQRVELSICGFGVKIHLSRNGSYLLPLILLSFVIQGKCFPNQYGLLIQEIMNSVGSSRLKRPILGSAKNRHQVGIVRRKWTLYPIPLYLWCRRNQKVIDRSGTCVSILSPFLIKICVHLIVLKFS